MAARPVPCFLLLLILALALPWFASAALAQDASVAPVCEPPISTCGASYSLSAERPEIWPPRDDCPLGYACTCVPSCPDCDDCAAQVCVRDPSRECRTACDCEPGLGCFDGQCIAGFAPVYCCDGDVCPAGQQCQSSEGAMGLCPEPDPACTERVQKVSRGIAYVVEHTNRCQSDSDCVFVGTDTECGGTCGAYVNRSRADHVRKAIEWLDREVCSDFFEDGCPYATPGCLATVGRCVEKRCEGVPIGPGPPPVPRPLLQDSVTGGGVQHLAPAP